MASFLETIFFLSDRAMKIIDNKKDYYDYISGIRGIDEYIVFDRRGSTPITSNIEYCGFDVYFAKSKLYSDKNRKLENKWVDNGNGKKKKVKVPCGLEYQICLEVGNTHYFFNIERYIDENTEKLVYIPTLLAKEENCQKQSSALISFIPCEYHRFPPYMRMEMDYYLKFFKWKMDNPILAATFVAKLISPDEIYDTIYNYIMSTKEPNIVDKRTDIEKVESHGFDKKISFRNVK